MYINSQFVLQRVIFLPIERFMSSEISLAAEPIFHIGGWGVSNSILTTWVVILVIIFGVFIFHKKGLKKVPKGFQNILEAVMEFLYNNIVLVVGSKKKSLAFFPLVATFFLYIIFVNWAGLIPGVGSIGFYEMHEGKEIFVPLFRAGTADLNMTLALATISVVSAHIFGFKYLGIKHLKKYFVNPFKNPIMTGVGFLELFGELSKIISFSFRLFGNIFAGEVLLMVVTGLVAFVAPIPFYFLEIFVGFVQALVFGMLTLIFLLMASETAHE